jgi:DNA helicase-2/ATP-dependent DNA helicase PcrA
MSITSAQKANADQQQWNAARDTAPQVRLAAGPGTGKSGTIVKRVQHLLSAGTNPINLYVISFTRATCTELTSRIAISCTGTPSAVPATLVHVSTMHSLALKILRRANLLIQYPSDPILLDKWEQSNIYDSELSRSVPCTPTRAGEIRLAHDARWQTLNPAMINQAQITPAEVTAFNTFHASRTNLYSCVLPGEVVFKCVQAFTMGSIQLSQLPIIEHLIVDEFQDLNACDQEFVRILTSSGATLFIAGDDDQSIYSFRHADPSGIVQFNQSYPNSQTHVLTDCFRCTPSVLNAASTLINFNPNRIQKLLVPLYANAVPPVPGAIAVWSFQNAQEEAEAIATSCRELLSAGLTGREDEIVILISNRRLQLDLIAVELGNLGLPFEPPRAEPLTEDKVVRAAYSMLRMCKEQTLGYDDYTAYRTMLAMLSGVGIGTVKDIADGCIRNNQNFRQLFDLNPLPNWLSTRSSSTVSKVADIATTARTWSLTDTLSTRTSDIDTLLTTYVMTPAQFVTAGALWTAIATGLPQHMTLDELIQFLASDNESDQQLIIDEVNTRVGGVQQPVQQSQKKIRILTMHGAKGLSGKVVFVPSCEQGIMPSDRALQATGLVIEHRRLFYVSLTRAMAACILTHASLHTGAQAFLLQQRPTVRLTRSQFLNELGIASVNRTTGLSAQEATAIIADINNL